MPTLFISYKRGTTAIAPLMDLLKAAHYRLWFDRDDIRLGDPDWQARIDRGIERCDGVILGLSPAACASKPVQYEVEKALKLGKPIFPVILERLLDIGNALKEIGLSEKQHIEDFTDVSLWDKNCRKLLDDLIHQGLRVTRHDLRQERDRNNPTYALHQLYLKKVADQVGSLSLAQISPDQVSGINLENVYIDSPTSLGIGLMLKGDGDKYEGFTWWISDYGNSEYNFFPSYASTYQPNELGFEAAPLEYLIGEIEAENTELYKSHYENSQSKYEGFENVLRLHLSHIASACGRLVVLGGPGSGKSTFVKHLSLCLAGAGIEKWDREANLAAIGGWPHGKLTPIYIELRRFVASKHFPQDTLEKPNTDHLWNYIQAEILGAELAGYANDLKLDLMDGQAVLILDGLDEVPYPQGELHNRQRQLQALADSLNTRCGHSRIIVASRPYAYEGWKLPGFEAITIADFQDQHRVELASRLYREAGLDEKDAKAKAEQLNQELDPVDPELKDRPLFLTLMATIFLKNQGGGLPTRRGTLYRDSILLLLERWTASKLGLKSLRELLGAATPEDLYDRLAALAYEVHNRYGDQRGAPEIPNMLLSHTLFKLAQQKAGVDPMGLFAYLSENAGVLVSPGQNAEQDVFRFAHRTFQEYLAASHLTALCQKADSFNIVREHIESKPQIWREPCTLVGDVLADTGKTGALWILLEDLLPDAPPDRLDHADPRHWSAWLAAEIVMQQELHQQTHLRRGEAATRDTLIEWFVRMVETLNVLPPPERAACGRALGLLGDPRYGVGVKDDIPEIDWVDIPVGAFLMGSDGQYEHEKPQHQITLSAYRISRYPITYQQFQAFLDANDGSHNPDWWKDLAADDEHKRQPGEQAFKVWNHPRERVSWWDAVAFCRWLSAKLGYEVRLPTEAEWEKAARGENGLIYPYGNEYDPTKANTSDAGIRQTSAVGLFPNGASPYGVMDMSGNVYEWCSSQYKSYPFDATDGREDLGRTGYRVVRGGSWSFDRVDARAACRSSSHPGSLSYFTGFRVVCRPASV